MAAKDERITACLDALIEADYSPGIQYAHVSSDGVCMRHHAGMADLSRRVAVSDRTTFNGYSVTKTVTAAAVLCLVDRGQVSLDTPITVYLPQLPYRPGPTLGQVLTHTGGLANPNPLSWCHLDSEHEAFHAAHFVEEVVQANPTLCSRPGTAYRYSNLGYMLLGMLIESVSKKPYCDFIDEILIQPLRLTDGEYLAFGIDHPEDHAHGYVERLSLMNLVLGLFIDRGRYVECASGRWLQLRHLHVNGASYGGLIGNGRGFARYLRALLRDDAYLSSTSRALLFTEVLVGGRAPLRRGVGWFVGTLNGETYYSHAGGAAGYYCEIRVYPRLARGSVVMTNRTGIRDERLLDRIDGRIIANA